MTAPLEVRARVGGLDLRFRPGTAALAGALREWLAPLPPAELGLASSPVDIDLAFGDPPSLAEVQGRICLQLTPATLGAGLRGALGAALDRTGGALLHGAGVVVGTGAILCIAPSEGGKTTLCGKVAGRLPILSDETVALHLDGPIPQLGGTPFWSGPPLPSAAGLFPVRAVCFLRKGRDALEPTARVDGLAALLAEWHLPERPGATADAVDRAHSLLDRVPRFALHTALTSDPLPGLRRAAGEGGDPGQR